MTTTVKVSSISSSNSYTYGAASGNPVGPVGSALAEYGISTQSKNNPYNGTKLQTRITSPMTANAVAGAAGWRATNVTGESQIAAIDLTSRYSGPGFGYANIMLGFLTGNSATPTTDPSSLIYSGSTSDVVWDTSAFLPNGWTGIQITGYTSTSQGYITSNSPHFINNGQLVAQGYPSASYGSQDTSTIRALLAGRGSSSNGTIHAVVGASTPTYSTGPSFAVGYLMTFGAGGGAIGSISTPTGTSVSYNTTSDYRLKEEITPISAGLDLISALQPRTWKWKDKEEHGIGFIAHEVQEAVGPTFSTEYGVVAGEKDKTVRYGVLVDADGNIRTESPDGPELILPEPAPESPEIFPGYTWEYRESRPEYQSMDASFLIAPLVASVQELKAIISQHELRIAALEA